MEDRTETEEIRLPPGYPSGDELSDEDLAAAVRELSKGWRAAWGDDNVFHTGGEVKLALMQAGLLEQSRRELRKSAEQARATARLSLWIAGAATVVAALALAVSMIFGVLDYRSDKSWQDDQTRILTEIRDQLSDPP